MDGAASLQAQGRQDTPSLGQVGRRWADKLHAPTMLWMIQSQLPSMEGLTLQLEAWGTSIKPIGQQGVADVCKVHPDLVSAARVQAALDSRQPVAAGNGLHIRPGRPAGVMHGHAQT